MRLLWLAVIIGEMWTYLHVPRSTWTGCYIIQLEKSAVDHSTSVLRDLIRNKLKNQVIKGNLRKKRAERAPVSADFRPHGRPARGLLVCGCVTFCYILPKQSSSLSCGRLIHIPISGLTWQTLKIFHSLRVNTPVLVSFRTLFVVCEWLASIALWHTNKYFFHWRSG